MRKGGAGRWWQLVVTLVVVGPVLVGCGGNAVNGPGSAGNGAGAALASSGAGSDAATSQGASANGGSDSASSGSASGGNASGGGSGLEPSDCYSPSKNLAHVFDPQATGCTCDSARQSDACVGGLVLVCSGERWQILEDDSRCTRRGYDAYSPESCAAVGGVPMPSTAEAACGGGFPIGLIDAESSSWADGGYCCSADAGPALEACGGFSFHTCAASDYCVYVEGLSCGGTDASSYCRPRPTACDEIAAPVCACDGETYDNACFAHRAGMGIYSSGPCPHPTAQ